MFPIYLIRRDTASETVREPLSLKEGRFKSDLTKDMGNLRFFQTQKMTKNRSKIDHVINKKNVKKNIESPIT